MPATLGGITERIMTLYEIEVLNIDGIKQSLAEYRGKTILIVNVASKCGFTPQYTGLEKLYRQYRERGLVILGFPCDQFGNQEPGNADEIKNFCSLNYAVSFPLFAKLDVNGSNTHPLYQYLKSAQPGLLGTQAIKWNFTKFLVDAQGKIVKRYAPTDTPESLATDIEAALPPPHSVNMNATNNNQVIDHPDRQRYELEVEGQIAFIDYQRSAGVVTMTHAKVPAQLNGRGIGSALVKGALELARAQNERVIPVCPFIATYIQRHPEYAELLAQRD
jgi:glutathione peroxidase